MTIGRLLYTLFYKPSFSFRYHVSHFGLTGWYNLHQGERKMKRAAKKLSPVQLIEVYDLEVCFLTGANYWHQTIFCAYSLARVMANKVRINIYSDGTLSDHQYQTINKIITGVRLVSEKEVDRYLDARLPADRFPTLRDLRKWHPFFKRLIDIHCAPGWALHLDSDMLFFSYPGELVAAYQQQRAVYMKELLNESYFADTEERLKKLHGIDCLSRVNGGIVAYNGDTDYTELEQKAKMLRTHYPDAGPAQIEQTLMSSLLFGQQATALKPEDYKIFYSDDAVFGDREVVRHYIFKSKLPYFSSEWKKVSL